jgi:hypothetical protein
MMNDMHTQAARLYPHSEYLRREWIKAVLFLRRLPESRWILDARHPRNS